MKPFPSFFWRVSAVDVQAFGKDSQIQIIYHIVALSRRGMDEACTAGIMRKQLRETGAPAIKVGVPVEEKITS